VRLHLRAAAHMLAGCAQRGPVAIGIAHHSLLAALGLLRNFGEQGLIAATLTVCYLCHPPRDGRVGAVQGKQRLEYYK